MFDCCVSEGCLLFRTDGGSKIGLGHIMRCGSIAYEAQKLGFESFFVVSSKESERIVRNIGFKAYVVEGGLRCLPDSEAFRLSRLAAEAHAKFVIVDTYAATVSYLANLYSACALNGIRLAYIDDLYRCDSGYLGQPVRYEVDMVVNPGLASVFDYYKERYSSFSTTLLVGSDYVLVRDEFRGQAYDVDEAVERVLITVGSTNPDGILERLISACLLTLPNVHVDAIIGSSALFDAALVEGSRVELHRDPSDIASLMRSADLAISAGGTTLCELACIGVPTVAVSVVENQFANLHGWSTLGLGPAVDAVAFNECELSEAVRFLADSYSVRMEQSKRLRTTIDGQGASRVANALVGDTT